MNNFPPELRTAAFVPRWNIIWSTLKDNVAQHSFFVAWYAVMVAKTIGWKGPQDYLMLKALYHDLDETITGDITGPVKKAVVDEKKAEEYLEVRMLERMPGIAEHFFDVEDSHGQEVWDDVDKIVAVADMMDGVLFLKTNVQMGNKALITTYEINLAKLEAKWRALPAPADLLNKTWQTEVLPDILAHEKTGGRGI